MEKQSSIYFKKSTLIFSVLFVLIFYASAQQPDSINTPLQIKPVVVEGDSDVAEGAEQIIELRQADLWSKRAGFDAEILTGNVVFFHEGAYMYCDSAYLFQQTNSFEAFSNVSMEQGDTIFVYGDYLFYDGNTRLARLRDNIRMEDQNATLFTDSLDYDRMANLGYYFEGGMLVDEENELTSFWGQYAPDTKEALFSDSVKLVNEDYTIYADTLKYNTETKVADILGPSRIVSDSGYIYTDNGWYNTVTEDSRLLDRSEVYSNDGTKVLIGDTIYYNRITGEGEVFGNMYLEDSERKGIIIGNYGFYNEKTEYGLATDSAYAIDYSGQDSLFLHGDTLVMSTDSTFRDIKAFYDVRFYRADIQGVCDSIHYSSRDSVIYMIGSPVVWNENNQISGYQINVHMNDSTIEKAIVKDYAMAIQDRREGDQYNQLSGRDMTAYFRDGEVYNVLVEGNAESLYYLVEEDSTIIGLNRTESPYLSMDIENNKIKRLKLWPATTAVTTPLPQLQPEQTRLERFVWLDYLRPISSSDIFRSNVRKSEDADSEPQRRFEREDITL
ncbi:MAG: OstA-like protein [Fermentimonas sp.]|jgi:lipopolysaccharide export system protein LptA|nr:OstA-like protein [Fermentimonas sp.]MDD4008939.1 OstA-like protein [Fermentimonas sp.]MDD4696894.1 OstA-like protein [Fermentimonas sp.]